jgi:hypothetical protein
MTSGGSASARPFSLDDPDVPSAKYTRTDDRRMLGNVSRGHTENARDAVRSS